MDNRLVILEMALRLFAARGYDAVGVQEISEAAGITKPTLYHYYGNKQGLLQAVLEHYQRPLAQRVEGAAIYQGDLPSSLENLARAYFDAARQHPEYYRLLLGVVFAPAESEACQLASELDLLQQDRVEALFMAAGRDHGNLRGKQRLFAVLFTRLVQSCVGLWLNGELELDEATLQAVIRQFQYGIYSG